MLGQLHHRDDGSDAVVAAAGAAHNGVGAAAHAALGAAGHPQHGVGREAVAQQVCLLQGRGDANAQGVLQAEVGQLLIHIHAIQHEGQLLLAALVHQGADLRHSHGSQPLMELILSTGRILLLHQHVVVPHGEDDVGVGTPDLADADAGGGDYLCPGIQLCLLLLDHHHHMATLHQPDGLVADGGGDVLQQLEALLRVVQAGAQSGGVLQPHPGEAGDAHAHAVLIDAGVDFHLDGDDVSADGMAGVSGGQGHAHRLRASQSGDDLLPQQGQQFFFRNHEGSSFLYPGESPMARNIFNLIR